MGIKFSKGFIDVTVLFIIGVIALGAFLTTGFKTKLPKSTDNYVPETPTPDPEDRKSLQLNTLKFKKVELPTVNTCAASNFNREPYIFIASDPLPGGTAVPGGRIRVWVDDGNGGSVSDGENIDKNTGQIITPGDRTATDGKGTGYYLWEPALYITPLTSPNQPGPYSGDAENGGKPYFPQYVRGRVVYTDSNTTRFLQIPPIESPVGFEVPRSKDHGGNQAQFIWEVNSLGLTPGFYRSQIVVHDGDGDLAINCVTIQL